MSGFPLILFGLAPLVNPSFEDDADAAAPSGWNTSLSVNPSQEVDTAQYHSAGHGLPSTRSLKQNVLSGTGGNQAVAAQRFQLPELLPILKEDGGELGATAAIRFAGNPAVANAALELRQFQGGSSTIGSGTPLTAPSTRSWLSGGPDWFLRVTAQGVHASTDWIELRLVYGLAGGYSVAADAWWDRVFCGGLVDLTKRFRRFRARPRLGIALNEGDAGAVEVVRYSKVRTEIEIEAVNLLHDTPDELALRRLQRWLESGAGTLAMWTDRDVLTNAGRHYQRLVHDDRAQVEWPAGVLRRNYDFRFIAPVEGVG